MRTLGPNGSRVRRRRGATRRARSGLRAPGPAAWRRIQKALLAGACAYGYPTDLWSPRRIADVVRKELGPRHQAPHVRWVLDRLGCTS